MALTGSRSIKRGKRTQASLSRETGYSVKQIARAIKALDLNIRRNQPNKAKYKPSKGRWDNRAWLITDDQVEKILYWLLKSHIIEERWCRTGQRTECVICGSSEKKHKGKGKCSTCYSRELRRELKNKQQPKIGANHAKCTT